MVAHVLRLRAALLIGTLRGDAGHVIRVVLGFLLVVAGTAAACAAILTLRDAATEVALAVTVLGGSAITLGFALAPIVAGTSDPLDPRRFAVFGLPHAPLAAVLGVAGLISIPILAITAVGVSLVIVWSAHGVPWALGAIGVALAVVTCALLARVCMALTALFLRERRSRELTGVFVVAILVVVVPVGVFFSSLEWRGAVPPQLGQAVETLGITPLGAAWTFPAQVALGADAVGALLIAIFTVLVLASVWMLLVRRLLTTTERPVSVRERGGLGWFGVAPGTPGGGVAARSLVYWLRDRRYVVNMVVIPFAAVIAIVPLLIAGVPFEYAALLPVPLAALFLGWLPHNDLAYDSTAIWMHLASGTRGVSDRVGRLVPVLLLAVPLLAITIPLSIVAYGRWALLPAMIGVCASLFLTGLGLSSISSVLAPYAVARPGDSPFEQPQRTGAGGTLAQGFVLLGALVLSAPALWWGWQALEQDIAYASSALWTGTGVGCAVLVVGVVIGSAVFERSSSRLMEFAEST